MTIEPVASSSVPLNLSSTAPSPRSPSELKCLLAAGRLDPASVTAVEERGWRKHCAKRVRARRAKMARQLGRGHVKAATREGREMMRSLDARMYALWKADKRMPKRVFCDPVRREAERQRRFLQLVGNLDDARALNRAANPRVYPKTKRTGGHRYISKFGRVDKARQHLLKLFLEPFASSHAWQYALPNEAHRHGRTAACEALLEGLRQADLGSYFVHMDIRNFFGSISHEWLEEHLRIPRDVIMTQVHMGDMSIAFLRDNQARVHREAIEELARRGIPQGSVLSSLIAEMVMADILEDLAVQLPATFAVNYSDNLGLIVPADQVSAVQETLRTAFEAHPAGPFTISFSRATSIQEEFRFLGYCWCVVDGAARAYIPEDIWNVWWGKMVDAMEGATENELRVVREKIIGKCESWRLWDGVDEVRSELLRLHSNYVPWWNWIRRRWEAREPLP